MELLSVIDTSTPRTHQTRNEASFDTAEVFRAHLAGDKRALESLMRRFSPMMRCVGRRYLNADHDVDDAVQDAWLELLRSGERIYSPASLPGWLSVTTAHCALNIGRRARRAVPTAFDENRDVSSEAPDPPTYDDHDRRAVRDAVTRLPGRDRELIELLFDNDLSYAEVVARTGRPVGSIGPTRRRVIEKLRRDRSMMAMATDG